MDPPARRVLVSVSPRVLGDALAVVLREHDLEVEVRLEGGVNDAEAECFDLALTSGLLPRGVVAEVVVVIASTPGEVPVRIRRRSHAEERRDLRTLDGVLALVTELLEDLN